MSVLKEINLLSKIKSITCDSFSIEKISKKLVQEIDINHIIFELSVNTKPDTSTGELTVSATVEIFSDQTKNIFLGKLISSGTFSIVNFDEIVKAHGGKIPAPVVATFIGLLLSTTRGFLILKTTSTFLEGCMLPIVNPSKFFGNDLVK